jgi:hypothetical protein
MPGSGCSICTECLNIGDIQVEVSLSDDKETAISEVQNLGELQYET